MNILAIDTSTDYLALAVMRGGRIAGRYRGRAAKRHSSLLVPMIERLVKKCRLKPKDIDAFAVGVGPGSFTGLRIGVTTVKALSCALKKPILAVPTFDVIADNAKGFKGTICVVLDARKNKVYAGLYKSGDKGIKRISKTLLVPVNVLVERLKKYDKILLLGDGVDLLGKEYGPGIGDWYPGAEVVARIGAENFKRRKFVRPEDLEPLYIYSRECDIVGS